MNRCYRTVFNPSVGEYQATSELSRCRSRSATVRSVSRSAMRSGLYACCLLASLPALATDLPTGADIVSGEASISTSGNDMAINQSTDSLITNWQTFDIGAENSVTFVQPSSDSVALNRVVTSDASEIYGSLSANGKVFLINSSGILFGENASVDTAGLVASTLDISDDDFLDGNYQFSGDGDNAAVVNNGSLISDGGAVALLGGSVTNNGVISARLGTVALAAGNVITLDFAGDGLLSVAIDEATLGALVANHQLIQADGGQVILTASAADNLLQTVVNNDGIIQAASLEDHNGTIVLNGGDGAVEMSGTLDTSSVDTTAADEQTSSGGTIQISGSSISLTAATLDVSGTTGGGSIEIGAGYQGSDYSSTGLTDSSSLTNATSISIDNDSSLLADAGSSGDGGTIVVYAEQDTQAGGRYSATGGSTSGDGGLIETSASSLSVASAISIDTSAANGATGSWLLDPDGFTVGDDGDMTAAALTSALQTSNVTIQSTDGSGDDGDITIADDVSWSSNALTLTATHNINVNAVMTATDNAGLVANYGTGIDEDGVLYGLYTQQGGNSSFTGRIDLDETVSVVMNGNSYTVITDASQLADIASQLADIASDGYYVLGVDLGDGFDDQTISSFAGVLNGFGHTFSYSNDYDDSGIASGLFGTLENSALVSNLILTAGNIDGQDSGSASAIGALANINYGSIINVGSGVAVKDTLADDEGNSSIGGLVGINYGLLANSYTYSGSLYIVNIGGGLVGTNETSGVIVNSSTRYNGATVDADAATVTYLGGLVGVNNGTISKSYSTLLVDTGSSRYDEEDFPDLIAGGFVGQNNGTIDQSYAYHDTETGTGSMTSGLSTVGGFVGENTGTITNAYAYDMLYGNKAYAAGFAYINSGTIENSYARFTSSASSVRTVYGFVAYNTGTISNSYWTHNEGGTAVDSVDDDGSEDYVDLTTELGAEEASDLANYVGFDSEIWSSAGSGFPMLAALNAVYVSNSLSSRITLDYGEDAYTSGNLSIYGLQAGDTAADVLFIDESALSWGYLDAGDYNATDVTVSSVDGYSILGNFTVTPAEINLDYNNYTTYAAKEYDGTTDVNLDGNSSFNGLIGDQTLTFSYDASYDSADVAWSDGYVTSQTITVDNISVSDGDNGGKSSNYVLKSDSFTASAVISQRLVDSSELSSSASDKTYDGTTTADVSLSITDSLAADTLASGELSLEYDSADFDSADAGDDQTVTVSGISLAGDSAANYLLENDTSTTEASINPLVLTVYGSTTDTELDSTTISADELSLSGVLEGDTVNLSGTANLLSSEEGSNELDISNLTIDNANYTLVDADTSFVISEALRVAISSSNGVTLDEDVNTTSITTTESSSWINWQVFSIDAGETVTITQPDGSSVLLNRVTGDAASIIDGTLLSNGRVFLLNSNGVLFSSSSYVDVAALVASTLSLSNDELMDGDDQYIFSVGSSETGSVVSEGDIVIADGGLLALLSSQGVSQNGSLSATNGSVVLAATSGLTLTTDDTGLTDYQLDDVSGALTFGGSASISNGLLETAGETLNLDSLTLIDDSAAATWSVSVPAISIGDSGLFSADEVAAQLAVRNLLLNAMDGGITISDDIRWSSDSTLGLASTDTLDINARLNASGASAGLIIEGDYAINSEHLDYNADTTGYADAGITLRGANASLTIDGNDYVLLHDMDDIEAINDVGGSGYYAIANDIDASAYGDTEAVVTTFTGVLAGLGNTIASLTVDTGYESYAGLIGQATDAVFRDLFLDTIDIAGFAYIGGLLGYGSNITLDNIRVSGAVTGNVDNTQTGTETNTNIGGIAGAIALGNVNNVSSSATVTGNQADAISADITITTGNIGGLIGGASGITLTNAYNTGDVTGHSGVGGLIGRINSYTATDGTVVDSVVEYAWNTGSISGDDVYLDDGTAGNISYAVGGLFGSVANAIISHVWSTGDVYGGGYTGGLIGAATDSDISDASASGDVYAYNVENDHFFQTSIGGLIGDMSGGSVSDSSASGDVYADSTDDPYYTYMSVGVGGLVGTLEDGTISNSSATGNVTGGSMVGGLVGQNEGGSVSDSSASGNVDGAVATGGLVGHDEEGSYTNSTSSGDVSYILEPQSAIDNSADTLSDGDSDDSDTNSGNTSTSATTAARAAVDASQQDLPETESATDRFDGDSSDDLALIAAREGGGEQGDGSYSADVHEIEIDGVIYQLSEDDCDPANEDCQGDDQ
ncbi:filamentous hemagglutinin N-terminal domain-containing protein [Oceanobacter sp. 3_MG-2023]|uniref:two-partner secretion domain-containing protein n=1 Tax=Oceanobacter sp. 3_MG-2023 TaxID=3062622 RepID=UPI002732828C|nr:filamentous hemagglutinin N-terminal domain-containing protein [Oceanobacter sp. 3_MG-2023]MDP2506652.1 filamentous hemagglutinin N-terminal domain-containing protein [Oceanobacter sp. 3_MG-2023]